MLISLKGSEPVPSNKLPACITVAPSKEEQTIKTKALKGFCRKLKYFFIKLIAKESFSKSKQQYVIINKIHENRHT